MNTEQRQLFNSTTESVKNQLTGDRRHEDIFVEQA